MRGFKWSGIGMVLPLAMVDVGESTEVDVVGKVMAREEADL